MGWETSRRRTRLPDNWQELRKQVLERDDWTCQIQMRERCRGTASEVDHVVPGDDHSLGNLTATCWKCHAKKSSREGVAARLKKRDLSKRQPERHPGTR